MKHSKNLKCPHMNYYTVILNWACGKPDELNYRGISESVIDNSLIKFKQALIIKNFQFFI